MGRSCSRLHTTCEWIHLLSLEFDSLIEHIARVSFAVAILVNQRRMRSVTQTLRKPAETQTFLNQRNSRSYADVPEEEPEEVDDWTPAGAAGTVKDEERHLGAALVPTK